MSAKEGPPNPIPIQEQAPLIVLTVEEASPLAMQTIERRGRVMDDILGLNSDFAKAALAAQTEAAPAAVPEAAVAGEAVHQRGGATTATGTGQRRLETRRRDKGATDRKPKPITASVSGGAPVEPAPDSVSNPDAAKVAAPEQEKGSIVLGRYRDHEGLLCDVRFENGVYSYTLLEGPEKNTELSQPDAANMKALMGDEWQKVDDSTEPTPEVPAPAAPATEAAPVTPEQGPAAPEWTMERLLAEVPDGTEFVIRSKSGSKIEKYCREGGDILTLKSRQVVTEKVFGRLRNNGWTLEMSSAGATPAPEAPKAADSGAEKKELFELHEGDEFTRTVDGKTDFIVVARISGNVVDVQTVHLAEGTTGSGAHGMTASDLQAELRDGGYERHIDIKVDTDTPELLPEILAPGASKYFLLPALGKIVLLTRQANRYTFADVRGSDEETEFDDLLKLRDLMTAAHWREVTREQAEKIGNGWDKKTEVKDAKYQELFVGDIWVMRDETGQFINAYRIGTIFPSAGGQKRVNVEYLDEKLTPAGNFESFEEVEKAHMSDLDLENLRFLLAQGGYERHTQGHQSESAKAPEQPKPESRFVHIDKLGDEAVYVRNQDDIVLNGPAVIKVKRVEQKDGDKMVQGYIVDDNASVEKHKPYFVPYDEIADLAAREGWIPEKLADTLTPEAVAKMPDFFEGDMSEVQKLRIKADEARLRFVTTDYTQSKAWNKILGVLRLRDRNRDDLDTKTAKEEYERAVMALQEAQLAELKKEKLTPAELRERMAGMLRFYKYEERVELYKDRTIVAAEQKGWPGKVLGAFQNIGIAYNKLPAKVRLAVAVGVFAGAGIMAFAGAAGAAAGTLAARRVIASLGAGASMDELAKQGAEYLRKRSVTKEQELESEEIRRLLTPVHLPDDNLELQEQPLDRELSFTRMKELLKKDAEALDQKFRSQKREQFWRKTLVWGTAIGASSFFTYKSAFAFGGGGSSDAEDVRDYLRRHDVAPAPGAAASAVEHGASAPTATASTPEVGRPSGATPPQYVLDREALQERMADRAREAVLNHGPSNGLLREYTVTSANAKAGLWGILKDRLPSDFPKDGQNRAIQSLENAIRLKLDAMTPAERAAVGFHGTLENGKVNLDLIRPGDKILFEKLLTPEQIKTALEGKSIVLPTADHITAVAEKGVTAPAVDVHSPAYQASIEAAQNEMIAQDRAAHGLLPHEEAALKTAEDEMIAEDRAKYGPITSSSGVTGKSLVGVADPYEDAPARSAVLRPVMGQEGRVLVAEKLQAVSFNSPRTIAQFLAENPDRVGPFKNVLGDVRKSIFLTRPLLDYNAATAPYDYLTHRNMGMVNMFRVQETFAQLHNGTMQEYAYNRAGYPLHSSQVESLMRVVATAQDPRMLGAAGLPLREENIDQYTRRISALLVAQGNEQRFAMALRRGTLI